MVPVIHLRIPGTLAYRDLATRAVSAACKLAGPQGPGDLAPVELRADFTHEMVSALGEAFNNVVLHGYQGRPPGEVSIEIKTEADRMEVQVADEGQSFDPASVPVPDLEALPETGMGLFIIRSFVDVLSYQSGCPNVLRMVKYF